MGLPSVVGRRGPNRQTLEAEKSDERRASQEQCRDGVPSGAGLPFPEARVPGLGVVLRILGEVQVRLERLETVLQAEERAGQRPDLVLGSVSESTRVSASGTVWVFFGEKVPSRPDGTLPGAQGALGQEVSPVHA